MKFGKSLSNQIEETLPEWRDKFLSYKELKKALKLVGGVGDRPAKKARIAGGSYDVRGEVMTLEEAAFMELLEKELEKFNWFFTDKEEGYIIKQKVLQDQAARAVEEDSREELMKVWKEIVDFHGEMVLLENYSALNYTGLVKILKKYDKRTGALIRLPFIQKVLQQPFFTTDILNKLIKECEATLDRLFPNNNEASTPNKESQTSIENPSVSTEPPLIKEGEIPELEEIKFMESLYMKSTKVALKTLKEIRSGSSTVSAFSLPPLGVVEEERVWDSKPPVVEQLAK